MKHLPLENLVCQGSIVFSTVVIAYGRKLTPMLLFWVQTSLKGFHSYKIFIFRELPFTKVLASKSSLARVVDLPESIRLVTTLDPFRLLLLELLFSDFCDAKDVLLRIFGLRQSRNLRVKSSNPCGCILGTLLGGQYTCTDTKSGGNQC